MLTVTAHTNYSENKKFQYSNYYRAYVLEYVMKFCKKKLVFIFSLIHCLIVSSSMSLIVINYDIHVHQQAKEHFAC